MTPSQERAETSAGFLVVARHDEPVTRRDRSRARAGWRIFRGGDGFEAAIAEDVAERLLALSRAAEPNEWYGLLVGRVHDDAEGRHVVVVGVLIDADARTSPGAAATTPESELATRQLAARLFPDAVIVGWTHGHVRCGARYSPVDLQNQRTWRQPHALGIVCDPWDTVEGPFGVYRGPQSERLTPVGSGAADDARLVIVGPAAPTAAPSGPTPKPPRRGRRIRILPVLLVIAATLGTWATLATRRRVAGLAARVDALERRALQGATHGVAAPARSPSFRTATARAHRTHEPDRPAPVPSAEAPRAPNDGHGLDGGAMIDAKGGPS
ncbi:MAG: Mov34/MPN/PAD-1 family protein [Deltaproteobacteria bacterium]|nr:Mov34/MPN/PAD-1 family protein [Deltaproteobacteria bacterium]